MAENTGLNESDIISKLHARHASNDADAKYIGVDISKGDVKDMSKEGVLDLMATRQMGLKLATQAAVTILRVDHVIQLSFFYYFFFLVT